MEDNDPVEITLKDLTNAVLNETHAPELLPFKQNVVDHFIKLIAERAYIHEGIKTIQDKKIVDIYKQDAERVKYSLQLYLRCRLFKIEKFYLSLLNTPELIIKLSPSELEYAQSYKNAVERHFNDSFLIDIPEKLRSLNEVKSEVNMVPQPNLDVPVFCKARTEIKDFIVDPSAAPKDIQAETLLVLRYRYIKPYLDNNMASLL